MPSAGGRAYARARLRLLRMLAARRGLADRRETAAQHCDSVRRVPHHVLPLLFRQLAQPAMRRVVRSRKPVGMRTRLNAALRKFKIRF